MKGAEVEILEQERRFLERRCRLGGICEQDRRCIKDMIIEIYADLPDGSELVACLHIGNRYVAMDFVSCHRACALI